MIALGGGQVTAVLETDAISLMETRNCGSCLPEEVVMEQVEEIMQLGVDMDKVMVHQPVVEQ